MRHVLLPNGILSTDLELLEILHLVVSRDLHQEALPNPLHFLHVRTLEGAFVLHVSCTVSVEKQLANEELDLCGESLTTWDPLSFVFRRDAVTVDQKSKVTADAHQ